VKDDSFTKWNEFYHIYGTSSLVTTHKHKIEHPIIQISKKIRNAKRSQIGKAIVGLQLQKFLDRSSTGLVNLLWESF